MEALDQIGGLPVLMKHLLDRGVLHGDALTCTGKTVRVVVISETTASTILVCGINEILYRCYASSQSGGSEHAYLYLYSVSLILSQVHSQTQAHTHTHTHTHMYMFRLSTHQVAENLAGVGPLPQKQDVVFPFDKPLAAAGQHLIVLKGNLAPNGCVIKLRCV